MTEFEYDSYRKKNIAHSAARRKCGSKSKKCSLSTDNMTRKQWEERCGTIVSYHVGRPMVWAEFIELPKDLKEEYMNNLIQKYSVNARNMADMFGVSVATVFRAVKKEDLNVEFLKGRHPAGSKQAEFQRFLNDDGNIEDESIDVVEQNGSDVLPVIDDEWASNKEEQKVDSKLATKLDAFTMNFSGRIDVEMIANSLRYILGSGQNARIQIICEIE